MAALAHKPQPLRVSPAAGAMDSATAAATKFKERGNELLKLGRASEAVDAYTTALRFTPHSPILYSNRAAARLLTGSLHAALRDGRKAISLDPGYMKAYSRLVSAYCALGRVGSAADACASAVLQLDDAEPDDAKRFLTDRQYFVNEMVRLRDLMHARILARGVSEPLAAAVTFGRHGQAAGTTSGRAPVPGGSGDARQCSGNDNRSEHADHGDSDQGSDADAESVVEAGAETEVLSATELLAGEPGLLFIFLDRFLFPSSHMLKLRMGVHACLCLSGLMYLVFIVRCPRLGCQLHTAGAPSRLTLRVESLHAVCGLGSSAPCWWSGAVGTGRQRRHCRRHGYRVFTVVVSLGSRCRSDRVPEHIRPQ